MTHTTHLVIFAKAPQPGLAKTRLIPALGADGAARLALHMLAHTLAQALAAQHAGHIQQAELCGSPAPLHADGTHHADWQHTSLPPGLALSAQGEGDLGARLARASQRALQTSAAVLLIGTDCPALDAATLGLAAAQLQQPAHDAVLIPATDGGYCLFGFKQHQPSLFSHMPWSTPVVAQETLARCAALGWRVWQGTPLADIDEPADLAALPASWLTRHVKSPIPPGAPP